MGDKRQPEATAALNSWGFWTHKFTDAYEAFTDSDFYPVRKDFDGQLLYKRKGKKLVTPTEPGRFDMLVKRDFISVFVEVKNGEKSFSFSDFQQNKRDWWYNWVKAKFGVSSMGGWLFLLLGIDQPNYNRVTYPHARRAWIIPIEEYFAVEQLITPIQNSIPMIAGKGYATVLQENQWDAVHLFASYELTWSKGSWELPEDHIFRSVFEPVRQEAA